MTPHRASGPDGDAGQGSAPPGRPSRPDRDDLRSLFVPPPGARERVGIEVESGLIDPTTGRSASYQGERGILAVLETMLSEWGGERQQDAGRLTGILLPDGSQITLEHGGQIEYSSAPGTGLAAAVADTRTALERVAELADRFGLALVPGAGLPFDRPDTVTWVPMTRGAIMRDFFSSIGEPGSRALEIMATSTSTQVTLDYLSAEDFTEKLRMQIAASPVVAALLVNSPLRGGVSNGLLSHRSQAWLRMDPRRCGVLPPALRSDVGIDDVIDWALRIPMVYYRTPEGRYRPAPDRPFATILERGFDDGSMPTFDHWVSHMSQIWTNVRVRRTLELRAADSPPRHAIPAVPALWTGLSYHRPARIAAWDLLGHYSEQDHRAAMDALPYQGLRTRLGGEPVRELATELLRLARTGLTARVRAGLEPQHVLSYLDPLDEILTTDRTFAEQLLTRWESDLRRDPRRYVDAYRV
ncbi:glutamate-cysteine ligase family protein [Kitasatospora purpeofusca]|uniref:glutamate-cysteine ligase family protein n=1 Tax=Kitasatospora purpeofusca TaxID=67352 RepID=UPI0038634EDF|nr:glutamate-cysteine ligase family protein [Kitasatospora purpeofusca]